MKFCACDYAPSDLADVRPRYVCLCRQRIPDDQTVCTECATGQHIFPRGDTKP